MFALHQRTKNIISVFTINRKDGAGAIGEFEVRDFFFKLRKNQTGACCIFKREIIFASTANDDKSCLLKIGKFGKSSNDGGKIYETTDEAMTSMLGFGKGNCAICRTPYLRGNCLYVFENAATTPFTPNQTVGY